MARNLAYIDQHVSEGTSTHMVDRSRGTSRFMKEAETLCRGNGARLTPIRRKVFQALLDADRPMGAYELADSLAPGGRRLAPITVYRALDFLIEQGLAFRLACKNAYIVNRNLSGNRETAAYLICENCDTVKEIQSSELVTSVAKAVSHEGFRPSTKVLEITGFCSRCHSGAH